MAAVNKAKNLITEDRVFLLTKTEKFEYYIVNSLSKKVYSVIFNKTDNTYNCNCKNLKEIQCSHIKAVCILKNTI